MTSLKAEAQKEEYDSSRPDQEGAGGGNRVTRQSANDGADEALEPDQEAGVIVDGGDRGNQYAGQGPDQGRKAGKRACRPSRWRSPSTGLSRAVDGGGTQGFAIESTLKKQVENCDQGDGSADDPQRLTADDDATEV